MQLTKRKLSPGYRYEVDLQRIIDGDTIEVGVNLGMYVSLRQQIIRFYGINAPEKFGRTKKMGLKAKHYVEEKLKQAEIVIETFPDKRKGGDRRGDFRRWLGIVWYKKPGARRWKNLNEELVRKGLAKRFREN